MNEIILLTAGKVQDILQAKVEEKEETASTSKMTGITVDFIAPVGFSSNDEATITGEAFNAAVIQKSWTTGGTIVKVKGAFSPPATIPGK